MDEFDFDDAEHRRGGRYGLRARAVTWLTRSLLLALIATIVVLVAAKFRLSARGTG
jgi:hypothetical protein